jgi:predicted MPP superfamily phosphohydrolase
MTSFSSLVRRPVSRRRFLKAGLYGAAALALYASELERHWTEVTLLDIALPGLPRAFDGMRIAQLSDIHLDQFTEPFYLRHVVRKVNQMQPDAVFLTGDYVSEGFVSNTFARKAAWHCGSILRELECKSVHAVLGNHDFAVGEREVTEALRGNGLTVLRNDYVPIERSGGRFWLAGIDDPVWGHPYPELAIPPAIRNIPDEPVVLLCHAPDYADQLLADPIGKAIGLMLSGHTHGGQVRVPMLGALALPEMGKKYVEGSFRLGAMQLYVNRGIGTVGLPFRFNCPPEITLFTLRAGQAPESA